MQLVERVARAICAARAGCSPDYPAVDIYWPKWIPEARASIQITLEAADAHLVTRSDEHGCKGNELRMSEAFGCALALRKLKDEALKDTP